MALFPIYGINRDASTTVTNWCPVGAAQGAAAGWATTPSGTTPLSAPAPMSIVSLYVKLETAPGAGASRSFGFSLSSTPTYMVTIADTATEGFVTTDLPILPSSSDTWYFCSTIVSGTPAASGFVRWCAMVECAEGVVYFNSPTNSVATVTHQPIMMRGGSDTEANVQQIMPVAGTFSRLYWQPSPSPGAGNTKTLTLRVNGADTALTQVSSGGSIVSDTTHTVAVAAGDLVNFRVTITGTPASGTVRQSVVFTPTTAGQVPLLAFMDDAPAAGAAEYSILSASNQPWSVTEANFQVYLGDWTIKQMKAATIVATGAAKSYTVKVRKNAADTALSTTHTNTTAQQTSTNDVSITTKDLVSISATPASTPTQSRIPVSIYMVPAMDRNAPAGFLGFT